MAQPTKPAHQTKYSEQNIQNNSYDEDFGVNVVELLSYDPIGDVLKRVTTNAMGEYVTNDVAIPSATLTYVGKEDADGDWYIQSIDTTSGTSIRFATETNNPTYTAYADAWTDRATLTYGTYGSAF